MANTIKDAVQAVKAELDRVVAAKGSQELITQAVNDTKARLDQLATQFADQPAKTP
jgi:hypothetical protein